MKTSLLYARHTDSKPRRARLASDDSADNEKSPFHIARFVPACSATRTSLNLDTMTPSKPHTVKVPDSVDLYSDEFHFKNGSTERVCVIPSGYVAQLDQLDQEIEALRQRQSELIDEAWRRGRPLRVTDIR